MARPVITTDAPGCRETVIDGKNDFLVPMLDANALAAAMERSILQPELIGRIGQASRRIAEERFDVRKINQTIMPEKRSPLRKSVRGSGPILEADDDHMFGFERVCIHHPS